VLQQLAGHTPEFDGTWRSPPHPQQHDILSTATDNEKKQLRAYLRFLRFRDTVMEAPRGPSEQLSLP
jgi:hypothetical protein